MTSSRRGASSLMATRGLYSRPLRLPPMRTTEASPSVAIWATAADQSSGSYWARAGRSATRTWSTARAISAAMGATSLPRTRAVIGASRPEFASGGDHLPGALAYFSVGVLDDDENHAITLASLRRRSTSWRCRCGDVFAVEDFVEAIFYLDLCADELELWELR